MTDVEPNHSFRIVQPGRRPLRPGKAQRALVRAVKTLLPICLAAAAACWQLPPIVAGPPAAPARRPAPAAAKADDAKGANLSPEQSAAAGSHLFHLPDGFQIEQIAGPPLVNRPIHAAFDEQGRLYVTDSSGSNDPLEKQLKERPHRVVRLEDTDGDGRFDKSAVFADKMMFPEGAMWLDGSLYVAAPPSIWKLTDTNGDGKADRREEWFQGKTLTHCGNDLHGPYLGPDGWVYWCKGAYAEQTYERPGRKPLVTRAAHIFRCRPDAPRDPKTGSVLTSAIEPVMTGGMANPVDVVFTPGGERIFTTTFLVRPSGGLRDGLIHAVYGGVYGQRHSALAGHPRTGGLMPVLLHLGAAAPCGLTRYRSPAFGPEYRDNLFACLFNMHKVTRHVLKRRGATFQTEAQDFLVSDNVDFHPTDVIEDADGSLIVVDTGGWYKLCCPTSQLWKPDILGAIYRVRRVGAPPVEDPRGRKLAWPKLSPAALVRRLGDPRPAVRRRAVEELARRGTPAVESLARAVQRGRSGEGSSGSSASGNEAAVRRRAVWVLTRIDGAAARAAVRAALADPNETVRQAAIHSVSVRRDRAAVDQLVELLRRGSPHNRRAAAEALGRLGDPSSVAALLAATAQPKDRVLNHSLIYAMIEIGSAQPVRTALGADRLATRQAALIALDQMEGGKLQPDEVVPLLEPGQSALRQTAGWVVDHHWEWGEALVGCFRRQLNGDKLEPARRAELRDRLARFAGHGAVSRLLADSVTDADLPGPSKAIVLEAMARSGLKTLPQPWARAVTRLLQGTEASVVQAAVTVVRKLPAKGPAASQLAAVLTGIGRDARRPAPLRLEALAAVPGGVKKPDGPLFDFVVEHLDAQFPVSVRADAATVLVRARLTPEQLVALAAHLDKLSPLDIEAVLKAFQRSRDERVGLALVAGLKQSPARSALRIETLKPQLARFPRAVQPRAEELYRLMEAERAEQSSRLEHLLASLPEGDVRRGQAVFRGSVASCSACHAIGYLGGKVGPDLTHIARIRTRRDLLEAIVFPSASLVRSYEPVALVTDSGKVYNGLIQQETPEQLLVATGPNQEVRVDRDQIELIQPSAVSIMPTGLDKQLTLQQLADLIAFLETTK